MGRDLRVATAHEAGDPEVQQRDGGALDVVGSTADGEALDVQGLGTLEVALQPGHIAEVCDGRPQLDRQAERVSEPAALLVVSFRLGELASRLDRQPERDEGPRHADLVAEPAVKLEAVPGKV